MHDVNLYRDKLECSMTSPARYRKEPPTVVVTEPNQMTASLFALAALALRRNFFPRP